MTPQQLSDAVVRALGVVVDEGRTALVGLPASVAVERSGTAGRGDYVTAAALALAPRAGIAPRALAEPLAAALRRADGVDEVEVSGPGLLAVTVTARSRAGVLAAITAGGSGYGRSDALRGMTTTLGPPQGDDGTLARRRAALVDEVVARLAAAAGARVLGETGPVLGDPGTAPAATSATGPTSWLAPDALSLGLLRAPARSSLTLDVARLARHHDTNPAHLLRRTPARLSSLLRGAAALGLLPADPAALDPAALVGREEVALLGALAVLPDVVATAARRHEPHRVVRLLEEVAETVDRWHAGCPVLPRGDEEPTDLHRARLLLVAATRTVTVNGLALLGVGAAERM